MFYHFDIYSSYAVSQHLKIWKLRQFAISGQISAGTKVCMSVYLRFQGASTSQVIGAHNEWLWMIMMAKWYSGTFGGLKLPDICLIGEEKTSPRKLVPTRDQTQARCMTGVHATTWSTAVDGLKYEFGECPWEMGKSGNLTLAKLKLILKIFTDL